MTNRLEQFEPFVMQVADKDELRIPLDLSEWIDRDFLKSWVREEIETLDWANPELEKYLKAHPDFRPKALLSLMVYAYANGLMESEEIISALKTSADLRQIWAGPGPTTKEIGRFRRENRPLLKWGLVQILKRAIQQKLQIGGPRFPVGLRRALIESAGERLDLARHMDRAAQGA